MDQEIYHDKNDPERQTHDYRILKILFEHKTQHSLQHMPTELKERLANTVYNPKTSNKDALLRSMTLIVRPYKVGLFFESESLHIYKTTFLKI